MDNKFYDHQYYVDKSNELIMQILDEYDNLEEKSECLEYDNGIISISTYNGLIKIRTNLECLIHVGIFCEDKIPINFIDLSERNKERIMEFYNLFVVL